MSLDIDISAVPFTEGGDSEGVSQVVNAWRPALSDTNSGGANELIEDEVKVLVEEPGAAAREKEVGATRARLQTIAKERVAAKRGSGGGMEGDVS